MLAISEKTLINHDGEPQKNSGRLEKKITVFAHPAEREHSFQTYHGVYRQDLVYK